MWVRLKLYFYLNMYKILLIIPFCLVLFAFNNTNSNQENHLNSEKNTEIGGLHNQGLDNILTEFQKRESWTYDEIFSNLESYAYAQQILINESPVVGSISDESMSQVLSVVKANLKTIVGKDRAKLKQLVKDLGANQTDTKHLAAVNSILKNSSKNESLSSITARIDAYQEKIERKGELTELLSNSYTVLKSSIAYWEKNHKKWTNIKYESDNEDSIANYKFWDTVNSMAEGDLWSFAVGTIMAGPAGGIAAGCYGSAAVGIRDLVTGECC